MGDIGDPAAGVGELHALPEALFGDADEAHGLLAHLSAWIGARTVAVEAVNEGSHVHADDVAFLEHPVVRDAVDDHLVHRDAGGTGEPAVP